MRTFRTYVIGALLVVAIALYFITRMASLALQSIVDALFERMPDGE